MSESGNLRARGQSVIFRPLERAGHSPHLLIFATRHLHPSPSPVNLFRRFLPLWLLGLIVPGLAQPPSWQFERTGGVPSALVWETRAGWSYDLFHSDSMTGWKRVAGYPRPGTGMPMRYSFAAASRGFFRIGARAISRGDMVFIPGGEFQMGSNLPEAIADEQPVHGVQVSAFLLQNTEVTKAHWDTVATYALANGYDIAAVDGTGKAPDHPAYNVSWYEAIKYCNARSQMEGLTPCYTISGAIVKTSMNAAVECNWGANGYRLPTEAEWERAARGGLSNLRYAWGDTISHTQANYSSSALYLPDISPTRGYHPDYDTDPMPYTSPVGTFAPTGYGLHDVTGNLYEWCWDRFDATYYASSPTVDPRGPTSGTNRAMRGGSWGAIASNSRVARRFGWNPTNGNFTIGFRPARSADP